MGQVMGSGRFRNRRFRPSFKVRIRVRREEEAMRKSHVKALTKRAAQSGIPARAIYCEKSFTPGSGWSPKVCKLP